MTGNYYPLTFGSVNDPAYYSFVNHYRLPGSPNKLLDVYAGTVDNTINELIGLTLDYINTCVGLASGPSCDAAYSATVGDKGINLRSAGIFDNAGTQRVFGDGHGAFAAGTTINGLSPITSLTGDGTATGPGSVALTLATVNSNTGTFGDATHVAQVTVNAKGLATAAASVAITFPTVVTSINGATGALSGITHTSTLPCAGTQVFTNGLLTSVTGTC